MTVGRVSVVISARDAEATLAGTLDGLAAQDLREPYEVIVVDNGSVDRTAEIARRHRIVGCVIARARGEGPGAARNEGVRTAKATVLAFTDADCVPDPGWLREGLGALELADLVQGRVLPVEGVPIGPFDHTLAVTTEYGLYETANLFVRREWFDVAGGFEDWINADRRGGEKPERPFGEDALLAWRAKRAGARTAFAHGALVRHAVLRGTAREYVQERMRDRHFAALVDLIPELREVFLYRRVFLNRRSAAFVLGVAGTLAAVLGRRRAPAGAWIPWVWLVRQEAARRAREPSLSASLAIAAGDAVSFAGLLGAALAGRGPVL